MKQNDSKNRTDFFTEIGIALRRNGFDASPPTDGLMPIFLDGLPLCRITDNGAIRYRESDLGNAEREDALHQVTDTVQTVAEYKRLMDSAPILQADGLEENYQLLADFSGVVLTGHATRYSVQFVTWGWDYFTVHQNKCG